MTVLCYGTESSVSLRFAAGATLEQCGTPPGVPLANPIAAVAAARTTAGVSPAFPNDYPG